MSARARHLFGPVDKQRQEIQDPHLAVAIDIGGADLPAR
jgi:hypothetical protein